MWTYKTDHGTFWIRPKAAGRFLLGIDDESLGSYISPEQAADDVYLCATGYDPWDSKMTVRQPTDLSEWEFRPDTIGR